MTENAVAGRQRIVGSYSYDPVWYTLAVISLLLMAYGTYHVLLVFHTYYLNIDPFQNTLAYVASIDALLIVNPIMIFSRIRIGAWSLPVAVFTLLYVLSSFATDYDILILASIVNLSISFPRSKRAERTQN